MHGPCPCVAWWTREVDEPAGLVHRVHRIQTCGAGSLLVCVRLFPEGPFRGKLGFFFCPEAKACGICIQGQRVADIIVLWLVGCRLVGGGELEALGLCVFVQLSVAAVGGENILLDNNQDAAGVLAQNLFGW